MNPSRALIACVSGLALLAAGCSDDSSPAAAPTRSATMLAQAYDAPAGLPSAHPEERGLPAFYPEVVRRFDLGESMHFWLSGMPGTATLRGRLSRGGVEDGDSRLVVHIHQFTYRAPLPGGWSPQLVGRLALPKSLDGFVVSQEGGDSDIWTVYRSLDGELLRVPVSAAAPFGGGFTQHGARAYRTWMTRKGALFTRVRISDHRMRVWRWHLNGDKLVPAALGPVCFDPADETDYHSC